MSLKKHVLSQGRRQGSVQMGGSRLCFLSQTLHFLCPGCSGRSDNKLLKGAKCGWVGGSHPPQYSPPAAISGLGSIKQRRRCPPSWVGWYAVVWWSQQITRMNHTQGNKKAAGISDGLQKAVNKDSYPLLPLIWKLAFGFFIGKWLQMSGYITKIEPVQRTSICTFRFHLLCVLCHLLNPLCCLLTLVCS